MYEMVKSIVQNVYLDSKEIVSVPMKVLYYSINISALFMEIIAQRSIHLLLRNLGTIGIHALLTYPRINKRIN